MAVANSRELVMLKSILVAISFSLVLVAANADVYVWRSATGVLNYSDTPPPAGARDVKILRIPGQKGIGGGTDRAETRQPGPASAGGATGSRASASSGATTAAGGAPPSGGAGGAAGGGGGASAAAGGGRSASGGKATTGGGGKPAPGGTTTAAGGGTTTPGGTTAAASSPTTPSGGTTAAASSPTTPSGGTTAAASSATTPSGGTPAAASGPTTPSGGTTAAASSPTTASGGTTAAASSPTAPSGGTIAAVGAGKPAPGRVGSQSATFTSTLDEIANPERGFAKEWENLSDLPSWWLQPLPVSGYRLVSHRQLLSAYWNTPTLPQSFLNALYAGAALHRATGTKMTMQFSYDNVGGLPEPTLTTILGHIAQLKPFFTANADVISTVHGGFLGTYGEWAFSSSPSVGNPTPTGAARAAVRDAVLAAVPASIPIGWRNVNDLMTWYPNALIASQTFSGSNQARSGIHNDCFLNNPDDAGTYGASGVWPTGRTPADNIFRAYHAQVSNSTTTGGENCSDGQYKACSDVLYDGPTYHWRYLRDDWGTVYDDGWKAQGCYPEIKRSLGYRFQLDAVSHSSSAAGGSTVNVAVDLRNVGWARIFTARQLVVTLQNTTSGALISGSAGDMRLPPPQATSSTTVVVPVAIPAGTSPGVYAVYVSMPDIWSGTKGNADFAVRFANADNPGNGQAWDAANFRFKTGTTLTVQ